MRSTIVFALLLYICRPAFGQSLSDTSELKEVVVKAYFSDQPLLRSPASVSVISSQTLQNQPQYSLLPAINTAPGVRMEERSPGSYRLSIRGSLLRSPFGIRNVKIYLDDFLLTDAGGNTYLNILDASTVKRIEILKGPEGSIFGANSGGVVLVSSGQLKADTLAITTGVSAGYYNLLHQHIAAQARNQKFAISLNQSYQKSDGYRQNSAMSRKSVQVMPEWNYSKTGHLKALVLYSDLEYRTPGGLTLAQSQLDPRMARPATMAVPGAVEQMAGIYNESVLVGISHSEVFNPQFRHVVTLTAALTDFTNPFITNYETRDEKSLGIRTYFEVLSRKHNWTWQSGFEAQQTSSQNMNYQNLKGIAGEPLNFIDLKARQSFLFTRFSWQAQRRLNLESAMSLNFYKYNFEPIFPLSSSQQNRKFKMQLMPRVAGSYLVTDYLALRASVSRGYSPPTIEEIRPSNLVVNTLLEPERGWNYESGLRLSLLNNRITFDGAIFKYVLRDAIVRRVDEGGSDFYVNAGGTNQRGIEAQLTGWLMPIKSNGFFRGIKLSHAYTNSHFKFSSYILGKTDFSGNNLTGVPRQSLVSSTDLHFPGGINLYLQHNYVSSLPVNDANTAYADKYHLLQSKFSWQAKMPTFNLNVFFGIDNILDAKYSLGNDLNAVGSRFYNPAAPRNYYAGVNVRF